MSHLSRYPFRNPRHFLQAALSHPSELYTVLQDLWTNATLPLSPTSKNLLHHIAAQIPQTQDSASQLLRRLHIVSAQQIQALLREETNWETTGSGKVKEDDDTGEYGKGAGEDKIKKTKHPNDDDDDSSEYKPDTEDEDTREYCFCHTLSYGEMVGCENDQCPYEWFHLECVGLKQPPSESVVWYCPECRTEPGTAMKMK